MLLRSGPLLELGVRPFSREFLWRHAGMAELELTQATVLQKVRSLPRRVRQSSSPPTRSPTGRAPARLDPRWSPSLRSTLVPRPSLSPPLAPPPPVGNDAASAARPPTGGPASLLRSKICLALRGVPAPLARRLLQIPASGLPPTLSCHPALPRRDLWDSASPPHAPSWPAPPLPKDASSYWCRSRQPTSSASASKSSAATSSYSARSSRGAPKASE